jgi:protein arginine N-methyltransferase 1
MSYYFYTPWIPFSEVRQGLSPSIQSLQLSAHVPLNGYQIALKQVINEGDIVLNLGTGTGLLSLWALNAGAKEVYGIESDPVMLSLAIDRISSKGFKNSFIPINNSSFDVTLPKKVDVIIFENIGNLGDNEDFQIVLQDVFQRMVKKDGRSIPKRVETYLVPVCAEETHKNIKKRQISSINKDFSIDNLLKAKGISSVFNLYYDVMLPKHSYISQPKLIKAYSGRWDQSSIYSNEIEFRAEKDAILTGFSGYFVAQLSDNVCIDISEENINLRTLHDYWKQAFFPVERPIYTKRGDLIRINYTRSIPDYRSSFEQIYRWRGCVVRDNTEIASFDQCLDESLFKYFDT